LKTKILSSLVKRGQGRFKIHPLGRSPEKFCGPYGRDNLSLYKDRRAGLKKGRSLERKKGGDEKGKGREVKFKIFGILTKALLDLQCFVANLLADVK